MRSASNFLIGSKSDSDFAVFDFRVGQQVGHGSHDLGDPGFVVCTQQRSAICCNQRMPFVFRQLREAVR
ncbi:hypothetical protein D3C81_1680580 [compost metagenome]